MNSLVLRDEVEKRSKTRISTKLIRYKGRFCYTGALGIKINKKVCSEPRVVFKGRRKKPTICERAENLRATFFGGCFYQIEGLTAFLKRSTQPLFADMTAYFFLHFL